MTITDIVALAKNGYKPSDIKELIALAEEPKDSENSKDSIDSKESENSKESEETKEPNYETLYRQTLIDRDAALDKLAKAQKENVDKNYQNRETKSPEELLGELAKSFM